MRQCEKERPYPAFDPKKTRGFKWERRIVANGNAIIWSLHRPVGRLRYSIDVCLSRYEVEVSRGQVAAIEISRARRELRRITA